MKEALLQQLQTATSEEIFEKLKERNPLLIHNLGNKNDLLRNLTIKSLINENPGYIISDKSKNISLSSFKEDEVKQMTIYKNSKLCSDLGLTTNLDQIYEPFKSDLHCNIKYSLSLFKGVNILSLQHNKHNLLLLNQR